MHEFLEDPLEVGEGIGSVAPDLLDEGVDDRTAPAGVFAADEHPILVTELSGTDGVFCQIVIKFDLPVHKAGFQVRQLFGGIGERLSERTARKDLGLALEAGGEFEEVLEGAAGFEPSLALPFERPGALVSEPLFDLIDAADEQEDPRGDAWVVFAGVFKFSANVGEAGYGDDFQLGVALDEGLVGA